MTLTLKSSSAKLTHLYSFEWLQLFFREIVGVHRPNYCHILKEYLNAILTTKNVLHRKFRNERLEHSCLLLHSIQINLHVFEQDCSNVFLLKSDISCILQGLDTNFPPNWRTRTAVYSGGPGHLPTFESGRYHHRLSPYFDLNPNKIVPICLILQPRMVSFKILI